MSGMILSPKQLAELSVLRDKKEYPAMYGYLKKLVTEKIAASPGDPSIPELEKTANWLSGAQSINSNDRSFFSDMVRGSIKFAVATTGRPLTDDGFQIVSNKLAESVAQTVIDARAIVPPQEIIQTDVTAAVNGFGLQQWNWPGTIGDQFPSPFGLGQDFVQVTGSDRVEYGKNLDIAIMQNAAGLNKFLDRDTPFDVNKQWKMARDINKWIGENLYKIFPGSVETPADTAPKQLIDIDITPSPQPQQNIQGENKARQDVSNGYVVNSPTHSISFKDNTLNK